MSKYIIKCMKCNKVGEVSEYFESDGIFKRKKKCRPHQSLKKFNKRKKWVF